MAETEADIAFGAFLQKGDGGSPTEAFTDIGLEITGTGAPGISRSSQDATHMKSPNGYTELIYGLRTSTPFNLELNFVPSDTPTVVAWMEGDKGNWRTTFPDGEYVTYAGAFTNFEIGSLTPDGKMTASATFTPTGKATWTVS